MSRSVVWAVAVVAAVVAVGWAAVAIMDVLLGGLAYLLVGAAVVGGGAWLYTRARRSLAPGTRTQRRIEAAARTYRMRNR